MKKKGWVIRVVLFKNTNKIDLAYKQATVDMLITEVFRYAGLVTVHKDDEKELVFDIARSDKETFDWAESNAQRIRSFGINAAAAPKYL